MDFFSLTGEIVVAIAKHGVSATGLAVLVALIFRFVVRSTPFRRMVMRYLPKKLRKIDSEMVDMKSELRIMNSKLDAIARHMGVVECADLNIGSNVVKPMGGIRKNSTSSQAASARVAITKSFILVTGIFHLKRRMKMRDYLRKLGRTKFQAFLLMTATNITMLVMVLNGSLNLDAEVEKYMPAVNIIVQLIASAIYMWVEGSIDKAKVKAGDGYDYTALEAERKSAEDTKAA